ncbi:MAG: DUF6455 family protein [Antarcticimicrobium sp.]|uniref:DUF6455 family protein n=1 Tax=Antarcticimicrobium sp. TaxID=2824147 RepID=UPI0026299ED1|nr:DUF6455 family protein [Antarcticimicrobium sp.]MDF1716692.1 DUF6455 family protein [Antarcticimicrobium sp.]
MTAVLGRIMRHVRLISRMAKTTDADLVGAYETGDLSQEEWAEMVQSCRHCAWADDCDAWLEAHEAAPCAPETCPNRARFAALRQRAEAHEDTGG